jgi:uncharacterized protein
MRQYTPVRFTDVAIEGKFWRELLDTVLTRTIPSEYDQLQAHGILESLTIPKPTPPLRIPPNRHNFSTQIFWDSDVGKWIEAASYALSHRRDSAIEAKIDAITDDLGKAQLPDGYLNCWYIGREPEKRWTNLRDNHELYCAGHMLEGAVAYFQATGRRRLLDIMLRYVDHIAATFGPGENQKRGYCGHQEIEIALLKLYAVTRDKKHLDLAAYFIEERGQRPHYFDIEATARGESPSDFWARTYEYNQSHVPVREQKKVVGHAVRAMYMYSAMADLAAELGDEGLKHACETLWRDVTSKRMYVTAGLGPAAANEGFTTDYDLPNDTAYAETCASVALIFWAQRMLNLDLDGAYADVLELALYNGALAGLARDGTRYFYQNPLESDGTHTRWDWHPCPCCTMNVSRLVASVASYFYSTGRDVLAVHLYGGSTANVTINDVAVTIRQETDFPWNGDIRIMVTPAKTARFSVKLRIPGWACGAKCSVNGEAVDTSKGDHGYLEIGREWSAGDLISLELPMPIERTYAHPLVKADIGRVALKRGPLVYCLEQIDNANAPVSLIRLPPDIACHPDRRSDLFDGIVTIVADANRVDADAWNGALYKMAPAELTAARMVALPYFLWCNRGPNPMTVWIAEG